MRLLAMLVFTVVVAAQEKSVPMPVVHLNHAYVVPDEETYEAIRNSDFLRKEFGVNEERTTQRTDIRYTGIYFYGENTYFEFLKPDERNKPGDSKVALGVDNAGEMAQLADLLKANGIATETHLITRPNANGKQVSWFQMMDFAEQPTLRSLGVWTLEYDPPFLREWHTDAGTPDGVRRADVLARYAKVLNQLPEERLMKDITGITMHLHAAGIERSIKECVALGMRVSGRGAHHAVCEGRDVRFELKQVPDVQQEGIAALHFALRRPNPTMKSLEIGTMRLVFAQSTRATWYFMPERAKRKATHKGR
jgi:hypothetical protein